MNRYTIYDVRLADGDTKYELFDNNTQRTVASFNDYDLALRCANCLNGIRN